MVVFLSDFGCSEYVGMVKGVIAVRAPGVPVIDLFHGVGPQAVREGAWVLLAGYRYFPVGAVFLAVVDPGVGTARQALAIRTRRYFFVGPDNGLLYPAAADDGIAAAVRLPVPASAAPTFHARDVFAPTAARLAAGTPLEALGEPADPPVPLTFRLNGREGEIVRIDRFGNIVTNLPATGAASYHVSLGAFDGRLPFYRTYQEGAGAAGPVVVQGSAGTLEIAVPNGSAQELFRAAVGRRVVLA